MRNKKAKKAEETEYHVRVSVVSQTEVIREADPTDEWGADDLQHSHDFYGYEVVKEGGYWDFVLTEKPKAPLYLVYALYSTGDSFHSESGCLCQVFLTPHYADALAVMNAINQDAKEKSDSFEAITVKLPTAKRDETIGVSTWKGYFEGLEDVRIETLNEVDS